VVVFWSDLVDERRCSGVVAIWVINHLVNAYEGVFGGADQQLFDSDVNYIRGKLRIKPRPPSVLTIQPLFTRQDV
jgi:hypothetical protein